MRAISLGVVLIALGAVSACFDPPQPDTTFLCGANDECPADYECRADGCCHKIGSTSDDTCVPVDASADATEAPEFDASVSYDAAPIPDAGPIPDASPDYDATGDYDATPNYDASPTPILTALTASAIVTEGDTVDLMVTLDQVAPSNTDVALMSSMTGVATVPAMVTVVQGNSTAMFTVTGVSGGSATITATLGSAFMSDVTVAATTASADDILVTEFLALSSSGTDGEFVELTNLDTLTYDISAWDIVVDASSDAILATSLSASDPVYVGPGEIIYGVPNPAMAQDIPGDADFVYGTAGSANELSDTGSDLRLNDGATDIDIVDFTGWLTNTGTPTANQFAGMTDLSTQLDNTEQSVSAGTNGAFWCVRPASTPGVDNGACTAPLTINEAHVNPFGTDDDNEFIELRGLPGANLEHVQLISYDGSGVQTGINMSFAFGARVPLDGLFVLGDNTGGTTAVANADAEAVFGGLPDGPGAIEIRDGANVRDALGYGTPNTIFETAATGFAEGSSIARDAAGTDTDDNSADFHLDPSPTPGVENDTVNASVTSVSPDNGLATSPAMVTITGDELVVGATVTVGGDMATCTVTSATTIDCTFPANGGTVESVDVTVLNPGGDSGTGTDAFTYTGVLADTGVDFFCNVQSPPSTTTTTSVATEDIYGQIYVQGVTDTDSNPIAGISSDLGYGPDGSDVTLVNFAWTPAAPNGGYDFGQNNDEHVATLTVGAAGTYDYAYRFSLDGGLNYYYCDVNGSDDGYSATNAGDLTVN